MEEVNRQALIKEIESKIESILNSENIEEKVKCDLFEAARALLKEINYGSKI